METVSGILDAKGHEIWSIGPSAWVYDAIDMMARKQVGALLVTDAGTPVGIISERDYARKVILKGRSSRETPIRDIMTSRVIYTTPDMKVKECMALMTEKRIRHLPVMEGDKVIGMVSLGDLVKSIIEEQQFVIEQLERYIGGQQ